MQSGQYFAAKVDLILFQKLGDKAGGCCGGYRVCLEVNVKISVIFANEVAISSIGISVVVRTVSLFTAKEDSGTALVICELNYGNLFSGNTADSERDRVCSAQLFFAEYYRILGNVAVADLYRGAVVIVCVCLGNVSGKLSGASGRYDFLSLGVFLVSKEVFKECCNCGKGCFGRSAADDDYILVYNLISPIIIRKIFSKLPLWSPALSPAT